MQTGKAISVPAILKVGNGTLNQLGSYLKGEGLKQVVLIFIISTSHFKAGSYFPWKWFD